MLTPISTPAHAAALLGGLRFVSAEFMYRPRPTETRRARVFDFALGSRLAALRQAGGGVVFLCDSEATVASLAPVLAPFASLAQTTLIVNPPPLAAHQWARDTPAHCGWDTPAAWTQMAYSDRWARLLAALRLGAALGGDGWLVLPAHDAVWGSELLGVLGRVSERAAVGGVPALVSPYTPLHHSPVEGVTIPQLILDTLNAAFMRDSGLRERLRSGAYQQYWGKMGIVPKALCGALADAVHTFVWEDDLEIDRAARALGCGVRGCWMDDPCMYRQALPVFDRADLFGVVERTLHYSLHIPGGQVGSKSFLTQPADDRMLRRAAHDARYAAALRLCDAIVAACVEQAAARLEQYGMSWVDWGRYRYVVRPGDPVVQVWKSERGML